MTTYNPPRPWIGSYAEGVPAELDLPTGSLYDLVAASIEEFGPNVALEFFGKTTSYAEMGAQIDRAAEGLRLLGVQKGDPVALVLPNCPQHIVAFYAVLRLGAIVVEHNPLYTPRELRHQFEDHGARVVIAWDKTVESIQDFPRMSRSTRSSRSTSPGRCRSPLARCCGCRLPKRASRARRSPRR